jgi:hypothetical protein
VCKAERPADVHLDHAQGVLQRPIEQRGDERLGGVVDRQAHLQVCGGLGQASGERSIGQVAGEGPDLDAMLRAESLRQRRQHLRPPRQEHEAHPAGGERLGEGRAEPLRGPGDDCPAAIAFDERTAEGIGDRA